MTDSYNLSKRPKIVFIHGLNNNANMFDVLNTRYREQGYETDLIILPGHGDDRGDVKDFREALKIFDQKLEHLKNSPYVVVAFSYGALYLQHWLELNKEHRPLKQVLLAPALYIRKQSIIKAIFKSLPSFFYVKSFSPKPFRRFELMRVWEYHMLLDGVHRFQALRQNFKVPTLVLIDPKDELVDAQTLKSELEEININFSVDFYERKYLKGLGCHHIMFHPDYFNEADWNKFTSQLDSFLLSS